MQSQQSKGALWGGSDFPAASLDTVTNEQTKGILNMKN